MPTLTVSVPVELKKRMDQHPEINWPAYLSERLELRMRQLMKFEELVNSGKIK